MHVVTLDKNKFDEACFFLADEIIKDCKPVIIIGVRTGGAVVAERVCERLREKKVDVEYLEVSASRNLSTLKRESNISRLFYFLPMFALNGMRMIEHYVLRIMMLFKKKQERNIQVSEECYQCLTQVEAGCVYIIDDAIDSGATVKYLLDKFKVINPSLDFRVGVIVLTQLSPMVFPDVCLYQDVLIRFPWSNDFK